MGQEKKGKGYNLPFSMKYFSNVDYLKYCLILKRYHFLHVHELK